MPSYPSDLPAAWRSPTLSGLGEGITSATTDALSAVAVYPLALLVTRLKIQRKQRQDGVEKSNTHTSNENKNILAVAREIYARENGLRGLYAGAVEAAGKAAVDSLLRFLAYTYLHHLKSRRLDSQGPLSPVDRIAIGLLADLVTVSLTTPIEAIITRKQVQGLFQKRERLSEIVSRIYSERGLKGFWAGYSASLVLRLNLPVTLILSEALKRRISPSRELGTSMTFFLWILGHVTASAITYPFSVIKARAQTAPQDTKAQTIRKIAKTEGSSALYSGAAAETLRTLTGYGAGALLKDFVHTSLYQTHFLLSLLFERRSKVSGFAAAQAIGLTDRGSPAWGSMNATAELVGDYVEDEAKDWRSLYNWFWDRERRGEGY